MSVSPPARALLRFAAAPLPLQPGSQVRPLLRLQVYAIADELQRLLQRALRGRNGVLREEVLHLLFVCGIAEISRASTTVPVEKLVSLAATCVQCWRMNSQAWSRVSGLFISP